MTKRIITLVLALAMLATACAFAVAEDYKWSGTISVAQYAFGPIDDDQITALVEERLREYGYDVKFDIVYLENSQYETLLNLRLANQEAPDIFRVNGGTMVDQYYQQGVLKSWTEEFFRENAPDVAAFIDAGNPLQTNTNIVDATWAMAKRDGKMVCLPLISINQGSLLNVIYNTQWLEKLDREVPETLDDFVDLMYAFTNDDPDGNGENDTYGMSTTMLNIIFGAYGSWTGFMHMDTGFWYNVDGEIVSCDVMPGNKDALALLHQMYVDGVIDPEFVTGENQGGYWAISHSFVNGRIGVSHGARMTHYTPANLYGTGNQPGTVLQEFQAIQGPDAKVTIGPWIEGPDGHVGGFLRYTNTTLGANAYNAKLSDEKLAAIFQIMNIFATDKDLCVLAANGIEGKHFEYLDDEFHTKKTLLDDSVKDWQLGVTRLRGIYGPEHPLNEAWMEENYNSATNKWMKEVQASYKNLSVTTGYTNVVFDSLPSESTYMSELLTYRNETWLKIIQGELDVDYYDTYVEEWMKRGGAILTEEANEWYAAHY